MGGTSKALAMLAGRPLLQHVIDRLAPQVAVLVLSVERGDPALAEFGLRQVPDPALGSNGPLGGLLSVLEAMPAGCDWLLLSGRPSRLRAVADMVLAKMPVPPHRIVGMHRYAVGGWYPFRDSAGRVEDPKTYVSPFTLSLPLTSPPGYELLPYECHEGNYMLPSALSAERQEDAAIEADRKKGIIRKRKSIQQNLDAGARVLPGRANPNDEQ